jgi:hypothetical protein
MTAQTCPSPERWKEHLRGTLPAAEGEELAAHLDSCSACQRLLETLTTSGDSLLDVARAVGQEPQTHETALKDALGALRDIDAEATQGWQTPADATDFPFLDLPAGAGELGRLGPYAVLEVIGRGGMGVVFKAHDEQLNRVVAVKVLATHCAGNPTSRARFLREARGGAAINDDHVVSVMAVGEHRGCPYIVMPLIVGKSLQERIDETGPFEIKEILRIGMQTALGLAAAHKQGLIHRDIKPANILLEGESVRVKITDFGLARAIDDLSLSQSGVVAGTPMFMSPEQARGEHNLDARTDLFSLGSVLYAMATGEAPFRASGSIAVLKRVCEETPAPMREANPNVPDWLEAIVAKLHAKRPDDRFQSAQEVADLLGQHLAHLQSPQSVPRPAPVQPPPAPMPARRSSGVVVVLVIGAVACAGLCVLAVPTLLLFGVGFWTLASQGPLPERDPMMAEAIQPRDADVGMVQHFDWGDAVDPRGECRFHEEAGRFTMHVPGGNYQLLPGMDHNFNAPRLLREVDGDFSAIVEVQPFDIKGQPLPGVGSSPYQGAGLVVWQDSKNYIRYLIARMPKVGGPGPCAHTLVFAGGNSRLEKINELQPNQRYLNLERQGKTYRVRWGTDGRTWDDAIALPEVDFPRRMQVGLLAVNMSTQEFAPVFEEYRVLAEGK